MIQQSVDDTPIFIGGAGRSGTTLLRVMLDSHPAIACGPELKVIPMVAEMWQQFQQPLYPTLEHYHLSHSAINDIFATMIRSLLGETATRAGKRRTAEKTPDNIFFFQHLSYIFPRSPLVHVIRDGRDVVASLMRMDWSNPTTGVRDERTTDPAAAARYWVDAIEAGRVAAGKSPHYVEVRYEDLARSPETTLGRLLTHLGEAWDPATLDFHKQGRNLAREASADSVRRPISTQAIGRWKTDLTPEARDQVREIAGATLIDLGYAADRTW